MLTHICLENFKAHKQRTELQLAPITLLYGPNSISGSHGLPWEPIPHIISPPPYAFPRGSMGTRHFSLLKRVMLARD